jgi:hypothetical protein
VSDLYPTKTRLALLHQVANSQVLTDISPEADDQDVILLFPDAPTSWQDRAKVTARIREMEHAGWVTTVDNIGMSWYPTDAGLAVLAATKEAER